MKTILCVLAFFANGLFLFSQSNFLVDSLIKHEAFMVEEIKKHSTAIAHKRKHILYLDQSWQNSAVVTKKGNIVSFNGRYSVLDNHIELKGKKGMRAIRADRVSGAMIGDRYFISVPKESIKGHANTSFYEVLSLGKINLYLKHFLKTRMSGTNSLTASYNGEKEYYTNEELHYQEAGGLCQKLKSKKKILALFTEQKKEVEDFAKENSLKFKSAEDLKKIFDYYNSLKEH